MTVEEETPFVANDHVSTVHTHTIHTTDFDSDFQSVTLESHHPLYLHTAPTQLFLANHSFIDDLNLYISSSPDVFSSHQHPNFTESPTSNIQISSHSPIPFELTHTTPELSPHTPPPPPKQTRVKTIPAKYSDFVGLPSFLQKNSVHSVAKYLVQYVDQISHLNPQYQSFVANSVKVFEPTRYK